MTTDDISTEFCLKDDNIEKDRRRICLLNDVNYGILLCFLEKFRSTLDLPNYSLQRLEDHLINYQERISPRLIDFHFILLKRLSLAKNTQRDKFDSIITKFASRFDLNDSDHLTTTGYLQAEINVKIRILKNLLESQFDLNQTFKNTFIDKSAREIKSTSLGRDRFGVSYWLFINPDCFVRLFREDIDLDRTWTNVAKDREELEKFIQLLVTDSIVRKKFPDWAIDYEPYSSLLPSNEFQECYLPTMVNIKDEEEVEPTPNEDDKSDVLTKKKRGRPKASIKSISMEKNEIDMEIKQEEGKTISTDDEKLDVRTKQKPGRSSKGSIKLFSKEKTPIKVETKQEEDDGELVKKKRGRPKGWRKSLTKEDNQMDVEIKEEETETILNNEEILIKKKPGRPKGWTKALSKKMKQIDVDLEKEAESTSYDEEKPDEPVKKRPGRPKGWTKALSKKTKQTDVEIQKEGESTSYDDEKTDEPMKKRPGRSKSLTKPLSKTKTSIDVEKEVEEKTTPSRRGRKRKIVAEESSDDEEFTVEENDKEHEDSSINDADLSIRRSSRPRKVPTMEPTSVLTLKTISQIPAVKKKRSMNGKTKISNDISTTTNNKSGRSRGRRKKTSRRNIENNFCLSTSSSDEHIDYLSDDEYDSDDYLPNTSQLDHDENFFELDEDNNTTGEELRTAKTAQASTIITACCICLKSDRPEVLLLCDDCDDAYHLECLRPQLLSVPDGDWFCPLCEHKKLSNNLIIKLKELLINYQLIDTKRIEHDLKKSFERKIKIKEYSSDESLTASESEHENLENNLHGDESMLSISQTNEDSNLSSSHCDDINKNISQRGRHRRTRFDMNKMLHNDDESDNDDDSDTNNDDEYIENTTQITNFDLQLPKKMTRLLNNRYRPLIRNDQRFRPQPIAPRLCHTSLELNNKLPSSFIYVNGHDNSHQTKPVITNSNQTLKIVRRWNDVQRRNRLKTNNMKLTNETTSDCADENSVFCPDDTSPPRSNDSYSNHDIKDEDETIIRSKVTLAQPANFLSIYKSSTKNLVRKNDMNFDRLTRDIQYAVNEANTLSSSTATTTPKAIDQQHFKRIQKTNFSPYLTKVSIRPLPVLLPKPTGVGYKIFKSKDPPTTADLSNVILTPSSSSSLLDTNDEQTTSTMNT